MTALRLNLLSSVYAICRLEPQARIPDWVDFNGSVSGRAGGIVSISRTTDELSVLCEQSLIPDGIQSEKDWRCFKVEGPLSFQLTGILSSILGPLAKAEISILAFSTFDTDYVFVKEENLTRTLRIFQECGFAVAN